VLKIKATNAHANIAITQPCPANGDWWKLAGLEVLVPFSESHAVVNTLHEQTEKPKPYQSTYKCVM